MRALGVVALAAVMAAACASVDLAPHSAYKVDAKVVEYKGATFKAGDHVVIKSIAGMFEPMDTGHSIEVRAEPGRTGIVLGGVERADPTMPNEPIQIVLIRFDEQVWRDTPSSGAEVTLKPFEATIHADYVETVKK